MSETSSVYTAYSGNSYLFGGNAPYVEEMYENYLANPGSVPDNWREYFDALQNVPAVDGSNAKDVPHLPVINAFAERAKQGGTTRGRRHAAPIPSWAASAPLCSSSSPRTATSAPAGPTWTRSKRAERENIPELDAVLLRLQRRRPGNGVQHQQHLLRQGHDVPARTDQRAARNLLRHHRRRVHVHQRPAQEALVAAEARIDPQQAELLRRRRKSTSSTASRPPKAWSASCTPSTSARSAFRWKAARASSPPWTS